MRFVPFTAYCSVDLSSDKRLSYTKTLQKFANLLKSELDQESDINVASSGAYLGGSANGLGTKPQFGNLPAQLSIVGFYGVDSPNAQPFESVELISANESHSGYGMPTNLQQPTAIINSEVAALKAIIETAITNSIPDANAKVYKITYSGVVFGHNGYHFPAS